MALSRGDPRRYSATSAGKGSRIEEDLIDQLFNSSEKRLARLLLLLANFGKEGRPAPIVGKFSQETLAEMIGTTRSRVSFFMNKFRKLGSDLMRGSSASENYGTSFCANRNVALP